MSTGGFSPCPSLPEGMEPLLAALLVRREPTLPDTLDQGNILAENRQGSNDDRHTLQDGQKESGNSYEQQDEAHDNTHRPVCREYRPEALEQRQDPLGQRSQRPSLPYRWESIWWLVRTVRGLLGDHASPFQEGRFGTPASDATVLTVS